MRKINKLLTAAVFAAGLGGVTLAATSASAEIVCNRWHDCWRVPARVVYPAHVGVTWYPNTWVGYRAPHYHYYATVPAGRGYYYRGHWRTW